MALAYRASWNASPKARLAGHPLSTPTSDRHRPDDIRQQNFRSYPHGSVVIDSSKTEARGYNFARNVMDKQRQGSMEDTKKTQFTNQINNYGSTKDMDTPEV